MMLRICDQQLLECGVWQRAPGLEPIPLSNYTKERRSTRYPQILPNIDVHQHAHVGVIGLQSMKPIMAAEKKSYSSLLIPVQGEEQEFAYIILAFKVLGMSQRHTVTEGQFPDSFPTPLRVLPPSFRRVSM